MSAASSRQTQMSFSIVKAPGFSVSDDGYTLGGPFDTEEEAHAFYDAWYTERGFWVTESCETGPVRPLAGPYEAHDEAVAAADAINRSEVPAPPTHRLLADKPRPLSPEQRVAWANAGRLGLDAVERCSECPWQQLCHPLVFRWLFDLAQSGGWLSGTRLAESRLRGDVVVGAELAWDVLRETVRLGWLEVSPRDAVMAARMEPAVFASYRETLLLRELLDLEPRALGFKRGRGPKSTTSRGGDRYMAEADAHYAQRTVYGEEWEARMRDLYGKDAP